MAKLILSPLIQELSGRLGDHVVRRSHTGEFVLSKVPDMSNVTWSEAQKAHRVRFREANEYAKAAMADPEVRAHYEIEAKRRNKRPHNLAVSGYFRVCNLLSQ